MYPFSKLEKEIFPASISVRPCVIRLKCGVQVVNIDFEERDPGVRIDPADQCFPLTLETLGNFSCPGLHWIRDMGIDLLNDRVGHGVDRQTRQVIAHFFEQIECGKVSIVDVGGLAVMMFGHVVFTWSLLRWCRLLLRHHRAESTLEGGGHVWRHLTGIPGVR
jgi:hypothetical protein